METAEIKKTIRNLLKQVEEDKYREYQDDWKREAVSVLNEKYYSENDYDSVIYFTDETEFEDIVKQEVESRGWLGVKIFLAEVENNGELAIINAYGNAVSCDYELVEKLEEALKELE